jgi:hypothetical protein
MQKIEIKNAKYIKDVDTDKNSSIEATFQGEKVFVPLDESNRHYAEILKQVEAKTLTIADAD